METLNQEDRHLLERCSFHCLCSACARRERVIAKALRIIDEGGSSVRQATTESVPKEDVPLKPGMR